jgi:uncharacterized protein YyaL (SSP411 family)
VLAALSIASALAVPAGGSIWMDWGPEALAEARRQNRPIVLLLGDRACRACREAEGDALADPAMDERLRASFVGVRADRLDRPDLDDVFGTAATALGATRAYPLAVFLTPEGVPFAAQGAVGREDDGDRPGLARALLRRASDFARDPAGVNAAAAATLTALRRAQEPTAGPLGVELATRVRDGLVSGARPSLIGILFLLDEHARTGDAEARRVALAALDALAADGRPPESLAETALRIEAHARAFQAGGAADGERAAALAAGALRDLRQDAGGFRASRDSEDDRVPALGTGLMIGALAIAGEALDRPALLAAAREAGQRVLARLGPPARLAHQARGEAVLGAAFLDDYAALAYGLLAVDEASAGREAELRQASSSLVEAAVGRFLDPRGGGFFLTEAGAGSLPVRPRTGFDGDTPSGNGLMALALQRLAHATGRSSDAELGCRTVEVHAGDLARAPRGMETLARAAAACLAQPSAEAVPAPLPERATKGPVTLVASVVPTRVHVGQEYEVRVRLEVAPGWQVIAADAGAKDLVGFEIGTGGRTAAGAAHGCAGKSVPGPFGTERITVCEGVCERIQPLRLAPSDRPGETRLRLNVLFQACRALRCEPPQSVRLEVPLTVLPPGR